MRACSASTAVKTTTGVRKTLSREFSDSEVHQRVRRKSSSFSRENSKVSWAEGTELPRGVVSRLSLLDLASMHDDLHTRIDSTREGSWSLLSGAAAPGQSRKHPSFRRVMSAGLLDSNLSVPLQRHVIRPQESGGSLSEGNRLSPLPDDSDASDFGTPTKSPAETRKGARWQQEVAEQGSLAAVITGSRDRRDRSPDSSPPPPPPPPPPQPPLHLMSQLVPTAFQWWGACEAVFLAGSFNEWKERIPLHRCASGREWAVVLNLLPGEYTYKYVVQGGDEEGLSWQHAPDQPAGQDGLGNVNNYITVVDQAAYEAEPSDDDDGGYAQHMPGELVEIFFAPEPPTLPPHLQPLADMRSSVPAGGGSSGSSGGDGGSGSSSVGDVGGNGIISGGGDGGGGPPSLSAMELVEPTGPSTPSHCELEHLCVSAPPFVSAPPAAAGKASPELPPVVTLSVKQRHRGKFVEQVLIKPAPAR